MILVRCATFAITGRVEYFDLSGSEFFYLFLSHFAGVFAATYGNHVFVQVTYSCGGDWAEIRRDFTRVDGRDGEVASSCAVGKGHAAGFHREIEAGHFRERQLFVFSSDEYGSFGVEFDEVDRRRQRFLAPATITKL